MSNFEQIHILMIDDSAADVEIAKTVLESQYLTNHVDDVRTGKEALQYLLKEGNYRNCKTPDLILLDMSLPDMDGVEILNFIKSHEDFARIPVVVLSGSPEYYAKCFNLRAACYVTKPINMAKMLDVVNEVHGIYLAMVKPKMRPV